MPWRANINKIKNQKAQQIRRNHNTIHQNNTHLKHRGTSKTKRRKKTLTAFIQALFNHPYNTKQYPQITPTLIVFLILCHHQRLTKIIFIQQNPAHTNVVQNYT